MCLPKQPPRLAAGDRALDRLAGDMADLEPPLHSRSASILRCLEAG
jgi:hypothetical protein